jgi:hypothetical protein
MRCIVASRRTGISWFAPSVIPHAPGRARTENMRRFMRITRPMAGT